MVPAMLQLDHLVIDAGSLDAGTAWCERTLGITPQPGGRHTFMGTHNRLVSVASAHFPNAYAEIIAIDPAADAPLHPRWFGLDDAELQRALRDAPQLIHWVARTADIGASTAALRAAGVEPGDVTAAERHTPRGLLRWQIGVRADGRCPLDGRLPTLIEWGDVHPCDALPASGLTLEEFRLAGLSAAVIAALGPVAGVTMSTVAMSGAAAAEPVFRAGLRGPRGDVLLAAWRHADADPHAF